MWPYYIRDVMQCAYGVRFRSMFKKKLLKIPADPPAAPSLFLHGAPYSHTVALVHIYLQY